MLKVRRFLFKWRGGLVAPVALLFLWIAKPCPTSLFLGALLAVLGESLRLWAIGYTGEPTRSQELDAPELVTSGPYALVRNPLYLGNLLNGMAVATAAVGGHTFEVALSMWLAAALFLGFVYHNIIMLEQDFLLQEFGEDYSLYSQTVPALIPRLQTSEKLQAIAKGRFDMMRALTFERVTLVWQVLIWAILLWKAQQV